MQDKLTRAFLSELTGVRRWRPDVLNAELAAQIESVAGCGSPGVSLISSQRLPVPSSLCLSHYSVVTLHV